VFETRGGRLLRRPHWLKVPLPHGHYFTDVKKIIADHELNTVCQNARCPNIGECWGRHTATFMVMGNICTRHCGFCAVTKGVPEALDSDEPVHIAQAARALNLHFVVVTSVTRDDLTDGGAAHFAFTIAALKKLSPAPRIEVLIPDFNGNEQSLQTVLDARPDILNHNIETVEELYPLVRREAHFARSLELLQRASRFGLLTKSGIMLGLGETTDQVHQTMQCLIDVGCKMLTIGQYLAPSRSHLPVQRFVSPDEFLQIKNQAMAMGFVHVKAGPLVRSSYHADEQYQNGRNTTDEKDTFTIPC
jgi:lipoyl synthase